MQHTTFERVSEDGLTLFGQAWTPDDQAPRAVVSLVHGLGEHSGRYTRVAEAFTRAGYALVTSDMRGHGRSEGRRGHAPAFDALESDLAGLLRHARTHYPDCPQFLYGHSVGGGLVLHYALRHRPSLAGVMTTSPFLRPAFTPPRTTRFLLKWMRHIAPGLTVAVGLDIRDLSRDPDVVQAYEQDPLVHDRASLRLGYDLLQKGAWSLAHAAEFKLPLLLLHGTEDRITSMPASREFAEQVSADCTFKAWDGLFHEPHHEPEQQAVLALLMDWLAVHSAPTSD